MALSLGKLTILVGAGLLGSVLAKEGQLPSVSDVLKGAFKLTFKTDSAPSSTKPKSDALTAQVNSLKQELQLLASSRPITIVTSHGGAGRRYGVIILCVVAGYGYIWWKGWKLPDLTFASKRSLTDACTSIGKQLEQVYSSISAAKRDLSSRIDRADCGLNDLSDLNVATRDEVSNLRGEMGTFDVNIQSVREVVESLESRIMRMQGHEDAINLKVKRLVDVAQNIERRRSPDVIQGSASMPAIEHPQVFASSRTLSMPPKLSLEPPSPVSSSSSNEVNGTPSASGLKDIQGMSQAVNGVASSPRISNGNGNPLSEIANGSANASASAGFFSRNIPFISRTRSATQAFK